MESETETREASKVCRAQLDQLLRSAVLVHGAGRARRRAQRLRPSAAGLPPHHPADVRPGPLSSPVLSFLEWWLLLRVRVVMPLMGPASCPELHLPAAG